MGILAKGSKSKLIWTEETTFGTAPTGTAYNGMLLTSETLDEMIDTLKQQDIRSDRTVPGLRGGNISSGGEVTNDFALLRYMRPLNHLLASGAETAYALSTATLSTLTNATPYNRGALVKVVFASTNHVVFLVLVGGTYTGTPATDLAAYDTATPATAVALGDITVSGIKLRPMSAAAAADPVLKTITLTAGIDFPSGGISLEKQVLGGTAQYVLFTGGRVDSLELTISQKQIVKSKWGLLFLSSQNGSASIANPSGITYPSDDPVTGYDAFIALNGNQVVRPISEGTITITNNVDKEVYVLGSRTRQDLPEGTREITGKITMYFKDATEYNLFKNETTMTAAISFAHAGDYLELQLGEVKLTGTGTPKISGAGLLTAQYDLSAFKQAGSYDLKAVLSTTATSI